MAAGGGGDGTNLDGLLKWSLAHSDGTRPARILSEEDRKWFMEAMQAQTVDVVKRMKEITAVMTTPEEVLESQGVTPTDIVGMLDELQDHVESIDMANDLHTIGGLVPLLGYLKNSDAGIRAKAADVVTTIVQNNPRSQQMVMEASGLEPLLANFTSDSDVTVRTKALGAISSLIRNNKPGVAAFRLANGYAALRDALGSDNIRFQRKALHLIQYLLTENNSDCGVVMELGFPRLMVHLASSDDSDVREAALEGLLEIARYRKPEGEVSGLADEAKLRQILQNRIEGISLMAPGDLGANREERQLIESLWNECYSEPSLLREKGLVLLPGEETLQIPPDVAGKMFESPLRACAANPPAASSSNLGSEKKEDKPQMLLGPPGPPADGPSNTNGGR